MIVIGRYEDKFSILLSNKTSYLTAYLESIMQTFHSCLESFAITLTDQPDIVIECQRKYTNVKDLERFLNSSKFASSKAILNKYPEQIRTINKIGKEILKTMAMI